ncbi:MAG: hypothetical protein U0R80_14250 [Nocardioidaceae bacterium]
MQLADYAGVVQLNSEVLAALEAILRQNSEASDWQPYENLKLSEGAFGGSDKGGSLGFHHTRAHQVVAETIRAMVAELQGFADGVKQAAALVETADTTAADDLTKRANEVHATDQNAYHHARNHQDTVPTGPATGDASTAESDTGTTDGGQG